MDREDSASIIWLHKGDEYHFDRLVERACAAKILREQEGIAVKSLRDLKMPNDEEQKKMKVALQGFLKAKASVNLEGVRCPFQQ